MKIFEVEFTLDEVGRIIDIVSNRINKDRNNLCLLLHFSTAFIHDWNNEISSVFVPMVIKGGFRDLGDTEKNNLILFITQSPHLPIGRTLRHHLNKVLEDWHNGKLSKIINDPSDINKLAGIIHHLQTFEDFAIKKMNGIIRQFLGMLI